MRKLIDQNKRKIIKIGLDSFAVTLPKLLVKQLGWKEKQIVTVKKINGALVIRDWKKK